MLLVIEVPLESVMVGAEISVLAIPTVPSVCVALEITPFDKLSVAREPVILIAP